MQNKFLCFIVTTWNWHSRMMVNDRNGKTLIFRVLGEVMRLGLERGWGGGLFFGREQMIF